MAKNYTRPLAEVYQLLEVTRQATGDHLSACIVGPTYDLYRYGIEKDVKGSTYEGADKDVNITYSKDPLRTYELDRESIRLYGEDLQKSIFTSKINGTTAIPWIIDSTNSRKLTIGQIAESIKPAVNTAFDKISIGDCAWIQGNTTATEGSGWQRRIIVAKDSISKSITVDAPFAYTSTSTSCFITRPVSGYIPEKDKNGASNWQLYTAAEPIKIHIDGALSVDDTPLVTGLGTLYPEFRVLHYPNDVDTEDIVEITTIEDIQSNFGTIDIGNDLAYGCYCALRGSAGRPIYAIRTGGKNVDAFAAAMKKTEFDSSVYSFAPLTSDPDVADAVVAFNASMSEPDVKMWRRTLIGVDAPGEYVLTDKDNEGKPLKLKLTKISQTTSSDGYYTVDFEVPEGTQFDLRDIPFEGSYVSLSPGDIISINNGSYECIVTAVSSNSVEAAITYAIAGFVSEAINVTLKKRDSVANTAEYVGIIAKKYSSRRASVVFCDGGTTIEDDRVVVVPNRFLAAEIAGISSAVVPQQSITHTVIQGINKASNMYSRYTTAQLDDIASQGVLIVTQDTKGSDCYIRHQLTTEMGKGNLYFEESCTRNLDNISYALADIVNKYIGRANVTTSALRAIKIDITAALTEFTQNSTDDMVGPSLVEWDGLEVYQDPKFKDRIIINVNLYLPLPLNNIKLYAMAYVATVSI